MSGRFGFIRHRFVAVALLVAGSLIAAWSLYPRAASAQADRPMRNRVYSTGPFTLQDGEQVRIGLVLPVVLRAKLPAALVLRNSAGQSSARQELAPPNPVNSQDSFFDVFFDITYHMMDDMMDGAAMCPADAAGENAIGGCFEIHSKGTPGGGFLPSDDGILTGLLLPAVRQNGMTASPLATSMQSFNMDGMTMTHSFFDVLFDGF